MKKTVLIIAAHPDDEILGCGGTMAKYAAGGNSVFLLILGEGITSRFGTRKEGLKSKQLARLKTASVKAARIVGIERVFMFDFPDNRFDTVPLLEIIKKIEKVKNDIKPSIVYTHHRNDLNIDHRIVYEATLTACRPLKGEIVKEIYSFEVPSSTNWNYPNSFSPNVFIDINKTIDKKIAALNSYQTELRQFPHPRSEEAVRSIAKYWGSLSATGCAEAFETIRVIT
jgi:LmbE family N-acetylglucosaminyl deacetylase